MKNKNGQMVMVNLLILVMTILILVAIIPILNTILGVAKQSDNLNCPGYDYNGDGLTDTHKYDYNSTLLDTQTDRITCIAIGLYVPYIVLAILIMGVTRLMTRRGPYEADEF